MVVRHQLIAREPSVLWAVLEDESRYADWVVGTLDWVVGTLDSAPGNGHWPEVGSSIKYTARVGPKEFHGRTTVRRLDAPRALELEAHGRPLGTARIAFGIRPWGEKTLDSRRASAARPGRESPQHSCRCLCVDPAPQHVAATCGSRRRNASGHGVSDRLRGPAPTAGQLTGASSSARRSAGLTS